MSEARSPRQQKWDKQAEPVIEQIWQVVINNQPDGASEEDLEEVFDTLVCLHWWDDYKKPIHFYASIARLYTRSGYETPVKDLTEHLNAVRQFINEARTA